MTQKRRKADSGKAIGEMTALRWEPTHVTKPNPRVVPLHVGGCCTAIIVKCISSIQNQMGTLSSSPCQLDKEWD